MFPYIDHASEGVGDEIPARDRIVLIDMLARLHNATSQAAGTAPVRRPDLATRPVLEAALGELGKPWNGGPYSEPARRLLARRASLLGQALASFDEVAREAARAAPGRHPRRAAAGQLPAIGRRGIPHRLDSVGLALPERDLWGVVDGESGEADRYAELTGRRVSPAAMRMYRMRWSLDEITLSLSEFRAPHEQNADTELTWGYSPKKPRTFFNSNPRVRPVAAFGTGRCRSLSLPSGAASGLKMLRENAR